MSIDSRFTHCEWMTYDHRCRMPKCTTPAVLLIDGPATKRHFCMDHALGYPSAITEAVERAHRGRTT